MPSQIANEAPDTEWTGYRIWWTSQADTEIIGERGNWAPFPAVPTYVRRLFSNRYGRSGRGRLW